MINTLDFFIEKSSHNENVSHALTHWTFDILYTIAKVHMRGLSISIKKKIRVSFNRKTKYLNKNTRSTHPTNLSMYFGIKLALNL